MDEWRAVRLGKLVEAARGFIKTGPFGSQLHAHEYTEDPLGVPVVMPKDMVGGRVDRSSVSRVDEITAQRLTAHRLQPGDLVLARRGDVGRYAFIEADEGGWLCGTGSMRIHVADDSIIWPNFLRHAMGNPAVADWLVGQAVGATMPNLNDAIVAGIPLRIPGSMTQRRVAVVVDAFDDLIEINERRIELLEGLARSLYREWFVRLRFPGHTEARFVDSKLGPVPEDWQIRSLGDVAHSLIDGDWIESKDQGGAAYRLLQVSNIGVGRFRETGNFRYVDSATFRRLRCTSISVGDILISRMPQPIGRAWLVDHLAENAITAVDVAILRPTSASSGVYLSLWLNSPSTLAHAESVATGTTRKRISRSVLSRVHLVVPHPKILDLFAEMITPLLNERTALTQEMAALARTRDLLLPRLVTGRLDISDVDLGDLLPEAAAA